MSSEQSTILKGVQLGFTETTEAMVGQMIVEVWVENELDHICAWVGMWRAGLLEGIF